MRKGILILGILFLIIGISGLVFGGAAYGSYSHNSNMISSGAVPDNATNQALVSTQFALAMGGLIGGGAFFVIGVVLVIIGFKGKSKKEKQTSQ